MMTSDIYNLFDTINFFHFFYTTVKHIVATIENLDFNAQD